MSLNTKLVHVVASVDLAEEKGKFLYVNPTTPGVTVGLPAEGATPPAQGPRADTGYELVVQGKNGEELQRFRPAIHLPSDQVDPKTGLVDQNIPYSEGMKRLILLHNGRAIDTFEAGSAKAGGAGEAEGGISMGIPPPGQPEKRSMSLNIPVQSEPGISYTIQVRPAGEQAWQTIAVGRKTPEVVIDSNQFPGAERATVRVLRSTGFEDSVIAEDDMDLSVKK